MEKSPIIIGIVGKKLYLTIILAIILILYSELKNIIPKGNDVLLINVLGGSIFNMISVLIPCIFKFKGKSKTSKIKCTKSIFKDYFLLFLIILLYLGMVFSISFFNIENGNINYLWTVLSLKTISFCILSIIILKTKYYIHNIISLILFCIFTIINDFIFGYFNNIKLISLLSLLPLLVDDLLCCYMKYLIDKKYHSYWNILFFNGLFLFIIVGIFFIIIIILDPYNNLIFITIKKAEIKFVIINFFLDSILNVYSRLLLLLIILDYFSLNHALISFILHTIIINFISCVSNFNKYKYLYFLIPAVFQILSLLFFLEILEFNFCNLNKNTKRNIMLREEDEMLLRNNSIASEIEIEVDKDLVIKNPQEKKDLELYDIIDDEEEKEDDNEN